MVFFGFAIGFALIPQGGGIPVPGAVEVTPEALDPSPRFEPLGDPPMAVVNSFERTCMDCHSIIDSQPRSENLLQHGEIQLNHGFNAQCVNCHDAKDRNKLVARDGTPISFDKVEILCAQCHGTTFRQWERGVHGKTLGYWDADLGRSRRLVCTECHEPHSPRYEPYPLLPGPNTLRMGPQKKEKRPHGAGVQNPLLKFRTHLMEDAEDNNEDMTSPPKNGEQNNADH